MKEKKPKKKEEPVTFTAVEWDRAMQTLDGLLAPKKKAKKKPGDEAGLGAL